MTVLSPEAIVASVRELPSLPAAVMELIQSMGNTEVNAEELASKISNDQALAAKTLRLANSSFYGMSRQVTSIADATTILGLRTLHSVATAAGVAGNFSKVRCQGFDFNAFWRHCIGVALCAQSLAQAARLEAGSAFTLGLLHDIGRLALASSFSEQYAQVLQYQREQDCFILEAERAVLGTDHAQVGGLIAEHWRFAPAFVEAIAEHHDPKPAAAARLSDVVHVADNMAHALDLSRLEDDMVPPLSTASWSRFALDERKCRQMFMNTESQHEAVCQALLS
ncbi:MAG TPA: HDOD domain-containing protein [Burkholderiaceae bacterium]|nr:HDOD domain-containing protein [Burkholderiaceae bacterium]